MKREMRRKKQELDLARCEEILKNATSGVLNLQGLDGYPYGVPVNFAYDGQNIIFHGAKSGYKFECISKNGKASFTVIDKDLIVPQEYTSYFRSVMAFGEVEILKDKDEIIKAAEVLGRRFAPDETEEHLEQVISKEMPALTMYKMNVECITGKEAIELVNK